MLDTFRALEAHRARLSALTEALPEPVVRARPGEGAWSLAQLLDHLLRIDRGLSFDGAPMSRLSAATGRHRGALLCAVLSLPVRIPAPPGAGPILPGPDPDPAMTLAEWAALRAAWAERLGDSGARLGARRIAFRHPLLGPFGLTEALAFLLAHHHHHDAQVQRTLRALGRTEAL